MLWGLTVSLTRDAVTGTVDFGRLPGPMSGTIRMDGHLALSGAYTITINEGIVIDVAVTNWQTLTLDNERMTGRFHASMQAAWCRRSLSVDGELRVVFKVAGQEAVAASRDTAGLDQALARMVARPD